MSRLRRICLTFVGFFPASAIKNALLRSLGCAISSRARIGPILLTGGARISAAPHSTIAAFNVFRGVTVELGECSTIGSWNWFSSASDFRGVAVSFGLLRIGAHSSVTSRHYFDCSGGLMIGQRTTVGGQRTTILSHGIDFRRSAQTAAPVVVGDWSFVSTNCVLLMGSVLPDRSVLAAGAVLTRASGEEAGGGVWGGVPARRISDAKGQYFSRDDGYVGLGDPADQHLA